MSEHIGFYKSRSTCGNTDTIFGDSVIEVIIDMDRGHPDPRMTGIRMIEPVMMEGYKKFGRLAQTHQRSFSRIPIMVVRDCNIRRSLFKIGGTVPFNLVRIAACSSIEKVVIMHPNIRIARIQ
ncbi:hypothetical protein D3C75_950700 [compost metagenome]